MVATLKGSTNGGYIAVASVTANILSGSCQVFAEEKPDPLSSDETDAKVNL
jgi:hypothetical protein